MARNSAGIKMRHRCQGAQNPAVDGKNNGPKTSSVAKPFEVATTSADCKDRSTDSISGASPHTGSKAIGRQIARQAIRTYKAKGCGDMQDIVSRTWRLSNLHLHRDSSPAELSGEPPMEAEIHFLRTASQKHQPESKRSTPTSITIRAAIEPDRKLANAFL